MNAHRRYMRFLRWMRFVDHMPYFIRLLFWRTLYFYNHWKHPGCKISLAEYETHAR